MVASAFWFRRCSAFFDSGLPISNVLYVCKSLSFSANLKRVLITQPSAYAPSLIFLAAYAFPFRPFVLTLAFPLFLRHFPIVIVFDHFMQQRRIRRQRPTEEKALHLVAQELQPDVGFGTYASFVRLSPYFHEKRHGALTCRFCKVSTGDHSSKQFSHHRIGSIDRQKQRQL